MYVLLSQFRKTEKSLELLQICFQQSSGGDFMKFTSVIYHFTCTPGELLTANKLQDQMEPMFQKHWCLTYTFLYSFTDPEKNSNALASMWPQPATYSLCQLDIRDAPGLPSTNFQH